MAVIFIIFITNDGYAQSKSGAVQDTVKATDSIRLNGRPGADTTKKVSIKPDSATASGLEEQLGIKISKDALEAVVKAEASDSVVMDMRKNKSYLYGKVQVDYQDLKLNAGQVTYDQGANIVTAAPQEGAEDSIGKRGQFSQGTEKFSYDSLQYNFKSKRALVRNVQSQYGEGFIHSTQIKRNPNQVIYGAHSIYTTCALDTPHFGIVARRLKIVPNKVVVSGPANINIEGVPTPLVLPFALFPISQRQKSGFVLPTYSVEQARGLGLLNGGYYFYLNDHADLMTQANIFTKGSYALSAITNYNTIYRYQGGLKLYYAYNKTGESFEPGASVTKDFMVNWRHASDGKAVPGQTFNASVQVGTSSFYSNNSYDPNQILQNQYQSNITYSKNWQNKPYGLTISALHSQNTGTRQVDVTLPSVNFHVTQFNPFQRRDAIGSHWYDKITTSYNVDMLNRVTFYDSNFNIETIAKNLKTGIRHSIPVSASYTILRYVNMSFNVSYNEYWPLEKTRRFYNDAERRLDTITEKGFNTARDFNTSMNLSTRIYGMKLFKQGKLRGIRHVLTPTVGLSYRPDFAQSPFNYYNLTRLDTTNNYVYESLFLTSVVGGPPQGRAGLINFGLNNNLQIKVRSAKDTVSGYKNVTLIDGLAFNGSYNLAADSFRWSNVGVSFRTNVLDKINISSSATFDPYALDYTNGRRLPQTRMQTGDGLVRFAGANLSMGANFHSRQKNGPSNNEEYLRLLRNAGYNEYVDFSIPWSMNFSYTMNAVNNYTAFSRKDTIVVTHSFTVQSELQVTERWKLSVNTGYNFNLKQLSLTSIDVFRDLHCWAMHLQAFPFGPRKSYNFTLNVKASVLQDLKLMRRRDFRDAPF